MAARSSEAARLAVGAAAKGGPFDDSQNHGPAPRTLFFRRLTGPGSGGARQIGQYGNDPGSERCPGIRSHSARPGLVWPRARRPGDAPNPDGLACPVDGAVAADGTAGGGGFGTLIGATFPLRIREDLCLSGCRPPDLGSGGAVLVAW